MGLFMLFKVSFSLLNYIVDPDSFSDKSKGATTIAKNIIIVLVLIILAPFAFDLMTDAQNIILDEKILERFIFSSDGGEDGNFVDELSFQMNELVCDDHVAKAASDGDFIALQIFKGFYQPEPYYLNHYSLDDIQEELYDGDAGVYCSEGKMTVDDYLVSDVYNDAQPGTGDEDYYTVDYVFLWSTIVGVVVLLLFINVCIEIAKRAVKLGFLQLIAPIPIISYVDPKSGKDGMFKKWLKQLGSTWASLFIRLGAIYFAVYIIEIVCNKLSDENIFIEVFIIIGCLLFSKELPKLIEDLIPGLKMGGNFTLNPMKNLRENIAGYNTIKAGAAGVGGFVAGGLGGAAANIWGARVQNRNVKKQLADENLTAGTKEYKKRFKELHGNTGFGYASSIIAGATSSSFRSFWAGVKGEGKKGIRKSAAEGVTGASLARNQRDAGYNLRSKIYDSATDVAKIKDSYGTTDVLKGQLRDYQRQRDNAQRDENTFAQFFRDRINAVENQKAGVAEGLMKVFDNAFDSTTNKYVEKTYTDYRDLAGKEAWMSYMHQNEDDWNALSDIDKNRDMDMLSHLNLVANESEFNSINNAYRQYNESDLQIKGLDRKIKSTEENLRKKSTKGQ